MKSRGMLFKGEMVRAILAGEKKQTRRLNTLREFQPSATRGYDWTFRGRHNTRGSIKDGHLWQDLTHARMLELCPHGVIGDQIWIRETWRRRESDGAIAFRADSAADVAAAFTWKSPLHLARVDARIVLEIVDVRIQRLHDISEADAKAEGVRPFFEVYDHFGKSQTIVTGESALDAPYRASFACLWDEINGDRVLWNASPWVWAITFKRVTS